MPVMRAENTYSQASRQITTDLSGIYFWCRVEDAAFDAWPGGGRSRSSRRRRGRGDGVRAHLSVAALNNTMVTA